MPTSSSLNTGLLRRRSDEATERSATNLPVAPLTCQFRYATTSIWKDISDGGGIGIWREAISRR